VRKFITHYLWIAVLASVLVTFTDYKIIPEPGTWNILELRSLDSRFLFKKKPEKNATQDIVLIVIDDKSYEKIKKPIILYHTDICNMINYLVNNGAKVIGLDIELPSISLGESFIGGYESIFRKTFLKARNNGVDVVIGYSNAQMPPFKQYLEIAGPENLSMFNLTSDADASIRRQQLWFEDKEGNRSDSFPFLLAKKFNDKITFPGREVLIDYSLSPDLNVYSFTDVLQWVDSNRHDNNLFRGKVVIIGTLLSSEDRHPTPLYYSLSQNNDKRAGGVIIQATTLNTLLSKSYFSESERHTELLGIFIVSILTLFLCFKYRPFIAALLCTVQSIIIIIISLHAFDHLYIIRLVPLFSAILITYIATIAFRYYTEERKRKIIKDRFSSFVPQKMIDKIINMDIDKLTEGIQSEVVLFFCDMRGFSTYSEMNKSDPKKVVNLLNHFHKEMTEIILSNEGTVAQLVGDGIFAFFGAPVKLKDPVYAALKSAVQMKEKIKELEHEWLKYNMYNLRIGIGIHIGDAIVGNVGSIKKMYYTAIGDNTNVASRIEGLTKEYGETILISSAAFQHVQNRVMARPLGLAKIKGHSDVEIFAIDGIINELR